MQTYLYRHKDTASRTVETEEQHHLALLPLGALMPKQAVTPAEGSSASGKAAAALRRNPPHEHHVSESLSWYVGGNCTQPAPWQLSHILPQAAAAATAAKQPFCLP